ncbi:flavodoxin family protein [Bacilli bacterium]|nr:flavodoxin family protein [Bacilli bacterium]
MVNKLLEIAKQTGADTQIWYASDLNIKPCQSCYGCKKDERCVIEDDMQEIYKSLAQADALVFGSPIYMGQMTAQAKTFIDRLFAQYHPKFSPQYKEKSQMKLVLVFTQGNPNQALFQPYCDYTKKMFQTLEFNVKDMIIGAGTRSQSVKEDTVLAKTIINAATSLIS